MGARFAWVTAWTCAVLSGCGGEPSTPTEDSCQETCDHYRALGCEEGQPTPGGTECEVICVQAISEGLLLPVDCILASSDCEAARVCEASP